MKDNNTYTLKAAMDAMIDKFHIREKVNETKIKDSWEALMGAVIAKHTTKLYVKHKVLYIYVDSAPLRHELSIAKDKIVDLLNKELESRFIESVKIF